MFDMCLNLRMITWFFSMYESVRLTSLTSFNKSDIRK